MVSDLLTSPLPTSPTIDPNSILDSLVSNIREGMKERWAHQIFHFFVLLFCSFFFQFVFNEAAEYSCTQRWW